MTRSNQKSSHNIRQNPITNKDELTAKLRKSVVAVLSSSENHKDLVGNSRLVTEVAEAVFSSIYKKVGKVYYAKYNGTFDNMVENIMYNADKVRQIQETRKQIAQAAKVITDDPEVIKLETIYANVHEKLDSESSKDLDFFESKFKNEVDRVVYAGSGESLKNLPPRKDLLYLDLILVAEGTNNNKDTILAEDLKERYLTLIGMPLVEEHITDAIRGVFYNSSLVYIKPGKTPGTVKIVDKGGRLAVRAKAYVYKERFPREALVLKDRANKGLLRYSVELAFNYAECSFCHEKFDRGKTYCEHLLMRHHLKSMGFSRIVRDVYFIGGAYTTNPAEKDAVSLNISDPMDEELAKKNKKVKSSVINTDDTGKVDSHATASQTNGIGKNKAGANASEPNGGLRMEFTYSSVEELLADDAVNALIEARVNDIVSEERETFEASLTEIEEAKTSAEQKITELEASLNEKEEDLAKANDLVAEMKNQKRISDAIVDLQTAGYVFESQDEIEAFSTKISEMNDDQSQFVIDLMKKSVTASSNEETSEEESESNEESASEESESSEQTMEASRRADTNASSPDGENPTVIKVRQSWDERIKNITNM